MIPWQAPKWVPKYIPRVPKQKAALCVTPTPIQKWPLSITGSDDHPIQFYIKRDDLTGAALTGNKVRKLEFLLSDAVEKKCDTIIAWGASTSNHCRATAVSSARLGLECHLLLTKEGDIDYSSGNITLAAATGAKLYQMENCSFAEADRRMNQLLLQLADQGRKAYVIPRGGSSHVAIWVSFKGYNIILTI